MVATTQQDSDRRGPGLTNALWRVGAAALQLVGNRVELATVELEEELRNVAASVLWGVAVVALTSLALGFAGLSIVLMWWDSHPALASLLVALSFALTALGIGWHFHGLGRARESVLETTRAAIREDLEALRRSPGKREN